MSGVLIDLNQPTLKVALTQAGLTTGLAVECQVTRAVVTAIPKLITVPARGCTGESQKPGLSGWQLELAWLQDWTVPDPGGLSAFAFVNDAKQVWFELIPNKNDLTTGCTGSAWASSGSFGGQFGDGSAADSTATWPLLEKPAITTLPVVP